MFDEAAAARSAKLEYEKRLEEESEQAEIDWKEELEKRMALIEAMSYRVRVPSLPNCKHVDRGAWGKALEGLDIDVICRKHEDWVREQSRKLATARGDF